MAKNEYEESEMNVGDFLVDPIDLAKEYPGMTIEQIAEIMQTEADGLNIVVIGDIEQRVRDLIVVVHEGDVLECSYGHRWVAPGRYTRKAWLEDENLGGDLDDSGKPVMECEQCGGTMIVGGWQ